MDHMKEALKQKMGKHVKIEIHIKPSEGSPQEESGESKKEAASEGDDQMAQSKTDMAPMVKDSNEPGVITSAQPGMQYGQPQHKQSLMSADGKLPGQAHAPAMGQPKHMQSHMSADGQMPQDELGENPYAAALLKQAPDHPASGKTLDSRAKEQMLAKMKQKKGLKV